LWRRHAADGRICRRLAGGRQERLADVTRAAVRRQFG
jgi:hypothetical protein